MSYGRRPHYIYDNGESCVFDDTSIPWTAIAQLLWTLVLRAEKGDAQLEEIIKLGGKLREGTWERKYPERQVDYKVHIVDDNLIIRVKTKERPNE